ncbi:uncharacterized protein LOC115561050 [Gadus morhua]|uniref:uncharacterized protein LOC115561050 n=1 Tax=Gadus morhua TaxID=8049 RepID=UPI0011B80D5E|nr:uncharacterized protein LOC115561050 [Gadus morhua]
MAGFGSEYMKGETGSGSGKPSSPPSLEKESGEENMGEVRRVRSEFIQRVSYPVIKGLLDDLWQQKVFSTEDKDSVMVEQRFRADQARRLIDMVIGKGERASQIMIYCMKMRDKHLYSTLGLIPSPAGDIKAEVELKRLFSRARDKKTRSAGQDLSYKQLMEVAETLGQEWEQAALHLGLKTKDLDNIKAEHRPVAMQKQKMLLLWRRRRPPGEATAQDLLRGLEDLEDLPVWTRFLLAGLVQNQSKPVKKKPSSSSGQESRPGELSSSPPLKMPASDWTLVQSATWE